MGLFSRTPCSAPSRPSTPPSHCAKSGPRSRNAFLHFLHEFRQNPEYQHVPAAEVAMDAAYYWNKMSLHEKSAYVQAARNSAYVYHARNRRQNRVMSCVRKFLNEPHNVNLQYLASAVKQMRLWKYDTIRRILARRTF